MLTDMTEGSPAKILWRFSIPMLLSVVFQQLYNIVDSIVAGQYVGMDALAAVGASFPVTMIFMAVATGSNIGCSVVISQLFGARDFSKMKTAVSTSLIASAALSFLLTLSGFWFCGPLMRLLHTPQEIFSDSELYLRIYTGGLLFLFLYNICTGIFTALGDSRTPLYFLIASSLGNILLDLVFVIVFKFGVAGVAWATFLAQGISSASALAALVFRLRAVPSGGAVERFSFPMLGRVAVIAVPSILQQSFISVGNLFVQGLVNTFGAAVVAGFSAAGKLNTFAITSFTTLANGLSSFTAQNIGAGKLDRIGRGFTAGLIMVLCVVSCFFAAFFVFSGQMMGIFLDAENTDVIAAGSAFLRVVSPFYFVVSVKLIADGVLRGSGAMAPFMIATFSDLILRVVLAFVLAARLGSVGIWIAWPVGWTIAAALSYAFYASGIWKKRLFREEL
ncbi:MATE family efflux transporter [Anaerotruncus rubiinfantis]|uniref:MATE family efflux transporter n=1 Tax=Anaerotruncus rubiinfantis TaxID=1720200 RepID=UPI0034A2F80C